MKQPMPLFLADGIENDPWSKAHHLEGAAELRRLHAENERLRVDGIHSCHAECQRPVCRLTRERDALLEALRAMLEQFNYHTITGLVHDESAAIARARAAIKAVEEGK